MNIFIYCSGRDEYTAARDEEHARITYLHTPCCVQRSREVTERRRWLRRGLPGVYSREKRDSHTVFSRVHPRRTSLAVWWRAADQRVGFDNHNMPDAPGRTLSLNPLLFSIFHRSNIYFTRTTKIVGGAVVVIPTDSQRVSAGYSRDPKTGNTGTVSRRIRRVRRRKKT